MKNQLLLLLLICFLGMIACSEQVAPWQKQYDTVMEIHDEVMPEISKIIKFKKELRPLLKQEDLDSLKRVEVVTLNRKLSQSEDAMMTWMHEFKSPRPNDAAEQTIKYLKEEEKKISKVSFLMKSSIKEATAFFKQ